MNARSSILAVALLAACTGIASAQSAADSAPASLFKVDLTIPSAPAFALLQVDQSKAIQPGTVRDLALAFAGFSTSDNRFQIPASFAVEAAPVLLIARGLSLRDYQRQAWLSRMRLSVASRRETTGERPTRLAFGMRTSLFDNTDPRDVSNAAFRAAAYTFIDPLVCIDVAVWLEEQGLDPKRVSKSPRDVAELNKIKDTTERRRKGAELDSVRATVPACVPSGAARTTPRAAIGSPAAKAQDIAAVKAALLASLDSLQRDFEERHWNAHKLEIAAALSGSARDSTGRDPLADRQEIWVGGMFPLGPLDSARTWLSNVGIGATVAVSRTRDSVTRRLETGFVSAARLVGGSNAVRGFGEGQYTSRGSERGWLANVGAELRVVEGVWLQFTAGYTTRPEAGSDRHWTTGFEMRGAPAIGGLFGLR